MIRKDINELCLWLFKWLNVILDAKRLRCIYMIDLMTYLQKVACWERIKWQSVRNRMKMKAILTTWFFMQISIARGTHSSFTQMNAIFDIWINHTTAVHRGIDSRKKTYMWHARCHYNIYFIYLMNYAPRTPIECKRMKWQLSTEVTWIY